MITPRRLHALLATLLAATPLAAQPAPAPTSAPTIPAPAPKLIVVISVDQLSADLFAEYRSSFTGGFARLARGAVFPSAYQAHAATETCPGHSTILTGSHPARTGIIANRWLDQRITRKDKRVYCAEDPTIANEADASGYTASAQYLLMPTLGERLRAVNPASRTVSVSGKDRAALMMAGRTAREVYWQTPTGFAALTGVTLPPTVQAANAALAARLATAQPPMPLPPMCEHRSRGVAAGAVTVGTGRFARTAGDASAFRTSPENDAATLALAAAMVRDTGLGRGAGTDVLAVGVSATDYVGHAYGTQGAEMCGQLMALDRSLDGFFRYLDSTKIPYVVALTADHGGLDLPERADIQAVPAAARVTLDTKALNEALVAELTLAPGTPVLLADGPFGDVYVSEVLPAATRARALRLARDRLTADPQVALVLTHDELAAFPIPGGSPREWSLVERARASFHPDRSGDLIVLLRPQVTPIAKPAAGYVATHGSPWDYDRRVPILVWQRGRTGFEQPQPVDTVDLLPTLAALVGLPIGAPVIDGRCLDLDPEEGTTCGR